MMKSWGCPWFPFVLELLRESAAKSTSPLTNFGVALFCCPQGAETESPGQRPGLAWFGPLGASFKKRNTKNLRRGGHRGVTMARQHRTRQPAPGHRDGTIRSPASYPTRARERQSSEVWCQPGGARKIRRRMLLSGLGPAPPGSNMPPHSGLGCEGPERIFAGAAAMKPWNTSSATNEPRNACRSFRLDPQRSGYGPILPQGASRRPEIGLDPATA